MNTQTPFALQIDFDRIASFIESLTDETLDDILAEDLDKSHKNIDHIFVPEDDS